MEVFMFGTSFDNCLDNWSFAFKRCQETNPVFNWEKCNFKVLEGIVTGSQEVVSR